MRKVSTLARQERATSASVVSRAQRTRRVAVEVRWNALSLGLSERGSWLRNWMGTYKEARIL